MIKILYFVMAILFELSTMFAAIGVRTTETEILKEVFLNQSLIGIIGTFYFLDLIDRMNK